MSEKLSWKRNQLAMKHSKGFTYFQATLSTNTLNYENVAYIKKEKSDANV